MANNGPAWRFWADGTWSDTSPDIQDVMNSRTVHYMDGTWSGGWDGSAYAFTASGCTNPNGNVNEVTGFYYPQTGHIEVDYRASRPPNPERTTPYCASLFGHSSIIASCRAGACEDRHEPFQRGNCIQSSTGQCYDETAVVCLGPDGQVLP